MRSCVEGGGAPARDRPSYASKHAKHSIVESATRRAIMSEANARAATQAFKSMLGRLSVNKAPSTKAASYSAWVQQGQHRNKA